MIVMSIKFQALILGKIGEECEEKQNKQLVEHNVPGPNRGSAFKFIDPSIGPDMSEMNILLVLADEY